MSIEYIGFDKQSGIHFGCTNILAIKITSDYKHILRNVTIICYENHKIKLYLIGL